MNSRARYLPVLTTPNPSNRVPLNKRKKTQFILLINVLFQFPIGTPSKTSVAKIRPCPKYSAIKAEPRLWRALVYEIAPFTEWLSAPQLDGGPPVPFSSLLIRMRGNPAVASGLLQKTMVDSTPGATHFKIISAKEQLDRFLYPYRALAVIAVFLGLLSFLLTLSGVFGMMSYVVSQRRKEFGIRIALGAGKGRVTEMVLRQALLLAAVGAVLGSLGALCGARVMSSYLHGINLFDASGYAAGLALVIVAALAAAWIPAMTAVSIDPARTLHCD